MKKFSLLALCLVAVCQLQIFAQEDQANFYDVNTIQDIEVKFDQDDWRYLLDSLRFNGDELLLGTVEINGEAYSDVGIRYRANRSFKPEQNRNAIYIKLNFIKKEQNHQGHKTLILSSALRDPSMVREVLGYEIARNYMPAPRANYAKVLINGEYYGLFVNVEPIEDAFLERNYGANDGTFLLCNPDINQETVDGCKNGVFGSLQYDNGAKCYLQSFDLISKNGWDDLIELTRVLEEDTDNIDQILDVDQTLWMLAFNNLTVNLSSYTGQYSPNYFLYRKPDGRFTPVIWETNLGFGSYKNTGKGSDLRMKQLVELDPLLHVNTYEKPLISKLLSDDSYKKLYLSHMRTILYDHFANGKYAERARALQELIKVPFTNDPNREYSTEELEISLDQTIGKRSKIPGIIELMDARSSFVKKRPALAVIPPIVSEISVMKRERFSSQRLKDFKIQAKVEKFANQVHLFYRFEEGAEFEKVTMLDDGKSNDNEASDEIFGVTITPPAGMDKMEYYIFAENAKAVSFDPPNYMYQQHTTSLTEINQ